MICRGMTSSASLPSITSVVVGIPCWRQPAAPWAISQASAGVGFLSDAPTIHFGNCLVLCCMLPAKDCDDRAKHFPLSNR